MCNFKRLSRSINLAFEAFPRLFLASITVILPLLAAAATHVVVVVYYTMFLLFGYPLKKASALSDFQSNNCYNPRDMYIFFCTHVCKKKTQRQVNIHVFFASHVLKYSNYWLEMLIYIFFRLFHPWKRINFTGENFRCQKLVYFKISWLIPCLHRFFFLLKNNFEGFVYVLYQSSVK